MFSHLITDLLAKGIQIRAAKRAERYLHEKRQDEQQSEENGSLMHRGEGRYVVFGFFYYCKMKYLLVLMAVLTGFCLAAFAAAGETGLCTRAAVILGTLMLAAGILMVWSGRKCGILEYSPYGFSMYGLSNLHWRHYSTAGLTEVRRSRAGTLTLQFAAESGKLLITVESLGFQEFRSFLEERMQI